MRLILSTAFLTLFLLAVGWQLSRGGKRWHISAEARQTGLLVASFAILAVALLSPVAWASGDSFTARTAQRMMVASIAPCLLMLANPLPRFVSAARRANVSAWLDSKPTFKRVLVGATSQGMAWGLFTAMFWLWHDADLAAFSLRYSWIRAIELLTLFTAGTLYWWHITNAAPRLHRTLPPIVQIVYAFVGVLPIKLTGVVLLFGMESGPAAIAAAAEPMYALFGTQVSDSALGAIILWVSGGTPFAWASIFLAGRYLHQEEEKPALPESLLTSPETWSLPPLRPKSKP